MTKVYKERANGRWEYWIYADGQRVTLNATAVRREEKRGNVKVINVA